jgi:nitroreductase
MACAAGLFGTMGIAREDKASRMAHMVNMSRAFGAPVIIYVIFNAELPVPYTMLDLGLIIHGICLAAHAQGLGSCIEAQLALHPDLVRRHLNLTPTHKIVVGIALGYPDPEAPANAFRTDREPLEKLVHWVDYYT